MAYQVHHFEKDKRIYASDFNEMDEQIRKNSDQISVDPARKTEYNLPQINDQIISDEDTWSSRKISNAISEMGGTGTGGGGGSTATGTEIDDQVTGYDTTWSSVKIKDYVDDNGGAQINDRSLNTQQTWSGKKIDDEIKSAANGKVVNDGTTNTTTAWSGTYTSQRLATAANETQTKINGLIADNATGTGTTWSSQKIGTAINDSIEGKIKNDESTSSSTVWSSAMTKTYVDTKLTGGSGGSGGETPSAPNLEGYATTAYVDMKIKSSNLSVSDTAAWSSSATKDYVDNAISTAKIMDGVATQSYVDGKIVDNNSSTATQTTWSSRAIADAISRAAQNAVNTATEAIPDVSDFATRNYVLGKIVDNNVSTSASSTWSSRAINEAINTAVSNIDAGGMGDGFYNVMDYGFQNNGTTANDTAWTNLINTVHDGDVIYFPVGSYLFNNDINITKKLRVTGAGQGTVVICKQNGFVIKGKQASGGSYTGDASCLEMMRLIPYTNNHEYTGVRLDRAYYCTVDRIHLDDVSATTYWNNDIHLVDPWYSTVSNCRINNTRATFAGEYSGYRGVGIVFDACVNICLYNNYIGSKSHGMVATNNRIGEAGYEHYCDGVQIQGGNIVNCEYGVVLFAGSNFIFNNLLLDQMTWRAYVIGGDASSRVGTVYVSNAYISCNNNKDVKDGNGNPTANESITIEITNQASRIYFSDCTIRGARRYNMSKSIPVVKVYGDARVISFTGCDICGEDGYEPGLAIWFADAGSGDDGSNIGAIVANNVVTDCIGITNINSVENRVVVRDNIIFA